MHDCNTCERSDINISFVELIFLKKCKRDRKQINIFEMKVYTRISGPVYDKEKENWRILTNIEIQRQ
jgi:hypothetical protein